MTTSYRVVIRGIDVERSVAGVAAALAPAFKVPNERMLAILQAPQFVVKKGVDLASAARFEEALKKYGCVCTVEPDLEAQQQAPSASTQNVAQPSSSATPQSPSALSANSSANATEPTSQINNAQTASGAWGSTIWRLITYFCILGLSAVIAIGWAKSFLTNPRAGGEGHQRVQQSSNYVRAGAIFCMSPRSFYKVNAIEMSRNPYVRLPDDCDRVGNDAAVNVIQYLSDPVVGNLALVGNSGGTAYVRASDLR